MEEDLSASSMSLVPQRSCTRWGNLEDHPSMRKFRVPHKGATSQALGAWREATFALNATRRFRNVADLKKKREAEERARNNQQPPRKKLPARVRIAVTTVTKLAQDAAQKKNGESSEEWEFGIDAQELADMVGDQKTDALREQGGVKGIAKKLHTSVDDGLCIISNQIQKKRLEEAFGDNKYPETPHKGFWMFVWEAMHDFTLIILAVCAMVSLGIGIVTEGWKEGWYDGAGIGFSIVLIVLVTSASDYKQSLQFRELESEKRKIFVEVVQDGRRQKLSIFDLLVGDVVLLKTGDQVPADGLYVCGCSLTVDESSMTGESEAKTKDEHADPFLLSGTTVQDGNAKMLVTGVGMNTEWGNLMATVVGEAPGDDETPLQVKLNGVATLIGKIGLAFAVTTFLVLLGRFVITKELSAMAGDSSSWSAEDALTIVDYFAIAVTIIVVAVPEGLPLAVTLTLAFAMKQMMVDKALVRHLSACETMGSATTICSDKTGTLTSNRMTVVKAWAAGAICDDIEKMKGALPDELLHTLVHGAFLNCDGDVVSDDDNNNNDDHHDGSPLPPSFLGSPTETAILGFGLKLGGNFKQVCSKCKKLKVEPFNSKRKRMGLVAKQEDGQLIAHWKGAAEIVLGSCDKTVDANGVTVALDNARLEELKGVIKSFADEALRTLCFAFKEVDRVPGGDEPIPDKGFVLMAIVGIKDPLRPGVKEAVRLCHEAGINVRMVTGDNLDTAVAIARECGILTEDGEAVEGPDFRNWDPDTMEKRIPKLQVMARSAPSDKLILVRKLRDMGEVVAATGDGTNDAPALHEADIGLAMGIAGTEVAKESADVVILDDNFSTIVNVAKWGRSVYTNIQKFVQFQLTVNLVALILNFSSACITGSAPLTAVQLLWVNLIMDTLGALALATERPYDELMERKPVGRYANFISNVMWRNIIGQAVYQLVVLTVLQYMGKEILHLHDDGDTGVDELLNTMIFNAFVFCQVFNEVNAREMEKFNVFKHTFNNKIFLLIIGFTVIFQFIMVQFLGKFAHTVPLSKEQWLITVSIGFVSLPIAAIVKLIPVPHQPHQPSDEHQPLLGNGNHPNCPNSSPEDRV